MKVARNPQRFHTADRYAAFIMTKKRLTDLIEKDLINYPVWKHWTENDIELVSTSSDRQLTENSTEGHIVLTEFVLNNGNKLNGFCSPQDTSGLDYVQPVLFTPNGHVNLYQDTGWDNNSEQAALKQIGLTKNQVFPIKFQTKVKCDNEFYSGTKLDFNRNK